MRSLRCLVRPTSVGVRAHRFARSRQEEKPAATETNSRKEQRHGAWVW